MRWLYFDPNDPQESAAHANVVRRIDQWWEQFAAKSGEIDDLFSHRAEWDLPAWMHEYLHAISPDLMWEYGPALSGSGHRLVITPEAERHLRPMVQTLLERAPKLAAWEFYPYRPPEDVELAAQTVAGRTGGDLTGALATATIGDHNRIDLCYYSSATRGPKDQQALHSAFVATETLIGEEIMDKWVGGIAVARRSTASAFVQRLAGREGNARRMLPLDRLKPTVDALITSIQDQLRDRPYFQALRQEGSQDAKPMGGVLKLEPTEANDYAGRHDLFVASTADLSLWRALHEDAYFCSERYSRHAECFCYLKLDGSEVLDAEKFPDRATIEDALNETLIPPAAGCVIGGGTGLRYSYIDLALANVGAAIPLIQACLRGGNINRRSWLLFFDATLGREWIGVYEDSPQPPALDQAET